MARTGARLNKHRSNPGAQRIGTSSRSRRQHFHSYSRGVRNHWRRETGGTNIGARGFRHTHDGRRHGHAFSTGVQEHWGNNPGGYSVHHEGYYHSHNSRNGEVMRKRSHRRRRPTRRPTKGLVGSINNQHNEQVQGNLLECWHNGNYVVQDSNGNNYCRNRHSGHQTLIQ